MAKFRISLIGLLLTAAIIAPPVSATMTFINEIHYDNAGADDGEAIEIAGPAGTDLSGWSVVLYNGAGGASYSTIPLTVSIDDEGGGFGAVSVSQAGIQNGAPDGIALVDNGGNVVQFLSYEGTFTATGGPASGLTSTDIGTQETSGTILGTSLQLIGPGQVYEDFTWYPASGSASDAYVNSFGSINIDQTLLSTIPTPTELLISEMVEGSSFNKALELANFTGVPIDLSVGDYEIQIYANGNTTPNNTLDLTGTVLNGDVFVMSHEDAIQLILDLADATFNNLLFNGDDAIVLTKGGSIIDVIGQIGYDPGDQWGSFNVSTKDNTLIRKPTVFGGDANGSDAFNPYVEWLGFEQNYFDGLGSHSIRGASQVPEPTTLALLTLGLAGLGFTRRRILNRV